jgi:hypothetical protein
VDLSLLIALLLSSSSSSSSLSTRKRFISPSIWDGASSCPGVIVVGMGDGGRQAMKVSLSASWRQELCMSYSSVRLNGSDAVSFWSSFLVWLVHGFIFLLCEGGERWGDGKYKIVRREIEGYEERRK